MFQDILYMFVACFPNISVLPARPTIFVMCIFEIMEHVAAAGNDRFISRS